MRREKSCGAVVWTMSEQRRLYLIARMRNGHFGFAKGHVESGETEEQTALREIREETGLNVELDTTFREVISYCPFADCIKDVVFFTAYSPSMEAVPQPEEIAEIRWVPYMQALDILKHPNMRSVLQKAEEFLNNKK